MPLAGQFIRAIVGSTFCATMAMQDFVIDFESIQHIFRAMKQGMLVRHVFMTRPITSFDV